LTPLSPVKTQKWPEATLPTIFENPGQGDNPNIALTRPQAIGPLTLVGQWSGGVTLLRDT
jgi:hypothetical protein